MANLAERARRLNRGIGAGGMGGRGVQSGFALLTDRARLADPLPLLPLLPAGSLVVLRHYGAADRAALGHALAGACRARRLTLVVADDFALAVRLGAGLHLPEARIGDTRARIRLWHRRRRKPLTAAAHGRMALVRAARLGADLALLSPVFATASHPDVPPLCAMRFRALARGARLPVWALGGVTETTLAALRDSGAAGVATVGNLRRH